MLLITGSDDGTDRDGNGVEAAAGELSFTLELPKVGPGPERRPPRRFCDEIRDAKAVELI